MASYRKAAAIVTAAMVAALAPSLSAQAAAGPTITNPATTRVNHGLMFKVTGTAPAGASVLLHYHKAGTPANDYSIVRSVVADASGAWSRTSTLDVDYRVYASVGKGNPHSATVLFTSSGATPPRTLNYPYNYDNYRGSFDFYGTAAPGVPVVIHYSRESARNVDIQRTVMSDAQGKWSRTAKLDDTYYVFATVGTGNPHTATVRFRPATFGDTIDIWYSPTSGTKDQYQAVLGTQLRKGTILDDSSTTSPVRVELDVCVRNRGPQAFNDDSSGSFSLFTKSTNYYPNPSLAGNEAPLDLSNMGVQELRCGSVMFSVPDPENLESFGYFPGLEPSYYAGIWQTTGPARTASSTARPATAAPNAAGSKKAMPRTASPQPLAASSPRDTDSSSPKGWTSVKDSSER